MQELVIRVDLDNDMVADWYERLLDGINHPIYQNGIQVVKRDRRGREDRESSSIPRKRSVR
jgi:hypothetical protein